MLRPQRRYAHGDIRPIAGKGIFGSPPAAKRAVPPLPSSPRASSARPPVKFLYRGRAPGCRKKWLAPLFRGFHSSLAPTARPGSYAGKPLLRKAFCGFDAHVAKSDYSLRGPRPPSPQGFLDKLRSAPVKFLYRGRAHSIVAPVGRGRVGATVRLGVLLPFLALVEIVARPGGRRRGAKRPGKRGARGVCPGPPSQSVEKPGYASGIRRVWVM